jgi:hypothetical protein
MGMPINIGSHVEVVAKAVGTLGDAQDTWSFPLKAFLLDSDVKYKVDS